VGNSIATAVVAKWEGELLPEAEAEANAKALDREAAATLAQPAHA
jgi:Na+/H+-dicarboxylate symporter